MVATCICAVGFLDVFPDKILGLIFYQFLFVYLSVIQNSEERDGLYIFCMFIIHQ